MKNVYFLYCLFSFGFYLLSIGVRADTVSILSDEWYPMNGSPASSHPGYMIEIAQTILAADGHKLDYRLAPWKRSILEVRQGNADCIIGAYKSDAPDFIFPDNPWGKAEFKFYTGVESKWTYQSILQLNSTRLGVIFGYSYSPKLDHYIKKNRNLSKVQVTTGETALEQNIRKLLANRIDAVISFEPVMKEKLTQLHLEKAIRHAGTLGMSQFMYIACSPNKESSQYYVQLFSSGIVELRKSGELKKILNKYGVEDWQVE
jgi:polar amino acid transport system substrate-binding protein